MDVQVDMLPVSAPGNDELRLVLPHEVRADTERGSLDWRFELPVDDRWLPRWRAARSARGLLTQFVALATAPPEDIAAFARRFGVLGVCSHGVPAPHMQCGPVSRLDEVRRGDPNVSSGIPLFQSAYVPGTWFTEPLALWRHWSRRLGAAREISAALRQQRVAPHEAWDRLVGLPPIPVVYPDGRARPSPTSSWRVNEASGAFAYQLNRLLWEARLHLVVQPLAEAGRHRFEFGVASPAEPTHPLWTEGALLQALVAVLLNEVREVDFASQCSVCGTWYELPPSARRPRSDRGHFCSDSCRTERKKETNRLSKRARRARARGD